MVQERDNSGLNQGGGNRDRKKSSENCYILKVETTKSSEELRVKCESN